MPSLFCLLLETCNCCSLLLEAIEIAYMKLDFIKFLFFLCVSCRAENSSQMVEWTYLVSFEPEFGNLLFEFFDPCSKCWNFFRLQCSSFGIRRGQLLQFLEHLFPSGNLFFGICNVNSFILFDERFQLC